MFHFVLAFMTSGEAIVAFQIIISKYAFALNIFPLSLSFTINFNILNNDFLEFLLPGVHWDFQIRKFAYHQVWKILCLIFFWFLFCPIIFPYPVGLQIHARYISWFCLMDAWLRFCYFFNVFPYVLLYWIIVICFKLTDFSPPWSLCLYSATGLQWDFSTNFQILYVLVLKIDLFASFYSFHSSVYNFYRFIYCRYTFSYIMEHRYNIWFEISPTTLTFDVLWLKVENWPHFPGSLYGGMWVVSWILWTF